MDKGAIKRNNLCRVYELPQTYPGGFRFGGGVPLTMIEVDWFYPIPHDDIAKDEIKPWHEYMSLLENFLKDKNYVKEGRSYLLITDFGESMIFGKKPIGLQNIKEAPNALTDKERKELRNLLDKAWGRGRLAGIYHEWYSPTKDAALSRRYRDVSKILEEAKEVKDD